MARIKCWKADLSAVLQRDRTSHGPTEQDDVVRSVIQRVPDRDVDVLPFGEAQSVPSVFRRRGVPVVPVGDVDAGHAQRLGRGERSKSLLPGRSSPMDHHGPRSTRRGLRGRNHPGRRLTDGQLQDHVREVEPRIGRRVIDRPGPAAPLRHGEISLPDLKNSPGHRLEPRGIGNHVPDQSPPPPGVEKEHVSTRNQRFGVRRKTDRGRDLPFDGLGRLVPHAENPHRLVARLRRCHDRPCVEPARRRPRFRRRGPPPRLQRPSRCAVRRAMA
jgi:hypothetical protein